MFNFEYFIAKFIFKVEYFKVIFYLMGSQIIFIVSISYFVNFFIIKIFIVLNQNYFK